VAGSLRRRRCGAAGSRIHGAQQGVVVAPPTCLGHHSQQQQQGPSGPILDLATAAPQTRPSVPERQRRGRFLVGPGTPRDVARAARAGTVGGSPPAASIIRMHAPTGPPVMPMRRYANRVTTSGGECRRSGTRQRRSSRSWAAASKLRVTSIPSGGLTPAHQHLSHLPDARPSRGALGAGVRLSGR
jgi:hypothetical protein